LLAVEGAIEIVTKPQTFGTQIKLARDATSGHKGGNPGTTQNQDGLRPVRQSRAMRQE
jgi:hypothetical protein